MLSQKYNIDTLNLAAKADWHPYPTAGDRAEWEALPEAVRRNQQRNN